MNTIDYKNDKLRYRIITLFTLRPYFRTKQKIPNLLKSTNSLNKIKSKDNYDITFCKNTLNKFN